MHLLACRPDRPTAWTPVLRKLIGEDVHDGRVPRGAWSGKLHRELHCEPIGTSKRVLFKTFFHVAKVWRCVKSSRSFGVC
jgi:hypothetical protein